MGTTQAVYLANLKKNCSRVKFYLCNGVPLLGKIIGIDACSVTITEKGQKLLIFTDKITSIDEEKPGRDEGTEENLTSSLFIKEKIERGEMVNIFFVNGFQITGIILERDANTLLVQREKSVRSTLCFLRNVTTIAEARF